MRKRLAILALVATASMGLTPVLADPPDNRPPANRPPEHAGSNGNGGGNGGGGGGGGGAEAHSCLIVVGLLQPAEC